MLKRLECIIVSHVVSMELIDDFVVVCLDLLSQLD